MTTQHTIELYHQLLSQRYTLNGSKVEHPQTSEFQHFMIQLQTAMVDRAEFDAPALQQFSFSILLNYIRSTHQLYIYKCLPEIELAISQLSRNQPELEAVGQVISRLYQSAKTSLLDHIAEEEEVLLPYITTLLEARDQGVLKLNLTNKMKLIQFLLHHNAEPEQLLQELMHKLTSLASRYDQDMAYRMLCHRLELLVTDLTIHSRIEEDVIIPKAFLLEQKVLQKAELQIVE